jgi:hypothetical protein|tara:strand:- start:523 stop:708 length:186 start_codon:yes stop_codon:yes gene_type:complete
VKVGDLVYDHNTNRNAIVLKLDATRCHCYGEEEVNMWKIINQDGTALVAYEDELEALDESR